MKFAREAAADIFGRITICRESRECKLLLLSLAMNTIISSSILLALLDAFMRRPPCCSSVSCE